MTTFAVRAFGIGPNSPGIPHNICVSVALNTALSTVQTDTNKATSDIANSFKLGVALAVPAGGVKWAIGGSALTPNGLITGVAAGIFVKTYFVTLPKWIEGVSQAASQYSQDVKACGGGS
jgi:hypothetical protein